MRLGAPIPIAPGVDQLRVIGARVTVLAMGDDVVLVDAGSRGSLGPITSGLDALGLSLERLSLVVLTHYHPDHSGSLDRVVEATPAKVAVHELEAGIIDGSEPAPNPFRGDVLGRVTRPFVGSAFGGPVDVDFRLRDGERLPGRDDIRAVHTPGHTAGSICLLVESEGVLIVGDALQHRLRRLGAPAASVTRDPAQAMESLERLLALDFDVICFSHFPPLRPNARGALEGFLRSQAG